MTMMMSSQYEHLTVLGHQKSGSGGVQEDDQTDALRHETFQDDTEKESQSDTGHGGDEPRIYKPCFTVRPVFQWSRVWE